MNSDAALNSVYIPETKEKSSHFHISCYLKGRHRTVQVAAMVDSGATALFLDKKYADRQRMWQVPLANPITLYNIDGSLNEAGSITHKVRLSLRISPDEEDFDFYVTSLGPEKVILGLPWLRHRNSEINWQEGTMHLNSNMGDNTPEEIEVEITCIMANCMERRHLIAEKVLDTAQDEVYCLAGFTYLQQIAEKPFKLKERKPLRKWFLSITETSQKYSLKKNPRDYLNINHGIILLPYYQKQSLGGTLTISPAEQIEL